MQINQLLSKAVAAVAVASFAIAPVAANAQNTYRHRQETKNTWRNLAYAGGGAALLGLLTHDSTVTFLGAAGGLYSAYRYEQDRKSQSRMAQARYRLFSSGSYNRNGHRYVRRTVWRHGQKYYRFVRVS